MTANQAEIPFVLEAIGPAEQRVSFRVGDSSCLTTTLGLRAGVQLGVTRVQLDPTFTITAAQPAAELELTIARGAELQAITADGAHIPRGGDTLMLSSVRALVPVSVRSTSEAAMECVSVSMSRARLAELLGVTELPEAFRAVTESDDAHPLVSRALTPRLQRLLDEIVNADAKGPSRLLWHEAKTLELIASMTDELIETARAESLLLSAHDVDRLERARRFLLEHLDAPPTLEALARAAGFNETTLKAKFRARFGTSVFAYLRQVRLEEARRLLLQRQLNVTEVAQRVGYANPSKFAAAFRKQFAMPPSSL